MRSAIGNGTSSGYFEARRVAHVNFYVGDLDRSMDFYTRTLGIEEVYRTPLSGGGFVSNGNTHHDVGFIDAGGALARSRGARPGTLNHFAFELDSETALVESYRRAVGAGHAFLMTMDHDIAHSVYNKDPDGNVYELYADVVADWRDRRTGVVTKPKPAWKPGDTKPVAERRWHAEPEIRRVEAAVFHPERTTHVALVVTDLEVAIDHYVAMAGLRVVSRGADDGFAVMAGTSQEPCLTLVGPTAARSAGFHHVGMRVGAVEDLDRSVTDARAAGIRIEVDIRESTRRAVLIRDPDGMLIQLYADIGEGPDPDRVNSEFALYLF